MKVKTKIKAPHQLERSKRAELFNKAHEALKSVSHFTSRNKFTSAAEAAGVRVSYSEKYLYISSIGEPLRFEIYMPWKPFKTIPQLLEIFEEEAPRYQFTENLEHYAPGLYASRREIESYFYEEMTAGEFLARKEGLRMALLDLVQEVAALTPNDSEGA